MDTYTIDPDRTRLTFTVPGLIRTHGEFTRSIGTVTVDEHGSPQSLDVTIAAGSLHTGISRRDEHLKTATFLEVQRYPAITYTSQHIEQVEANRYAVRGMLRLHGQVQSVALDVTVDTDVQQDGARQAHVKGVVPRTAFGIPSDAIRRALLAPLVANRVIVTADVYLAPVSAAVGATPTSATRQSE
jgi:polyisoprenoid-binding protein YceI